MDIVALQGVLDDKTLLLLSTADSRTVTRPMRHNAMKRQIQAQRAMRAYDERCRIKLADDRTMAQRMLACITMCDTLNDAQEAALLELRRCVYPRAISVEDARRWGAYDE